MYFTREDILKILKALLLLGIKDSEFKTAQLPLLEDDTITIVQNNVNRKVKISNIIGQFNILNRQDFINVSDMYDEHYITISEAIKLLPERKRKEGLVITFQNTNGDWQIYLFEGTIDLFVNDSYWKDLFDFKYPIIDSILPDEEDLTLTYPDNSNNSFIKLKDKDYNPNTFSGIGYKILRKNIVDDKNILTRDMINKPNTIYEIRYDFDLNGATIIIPKNSILLFQGGSFDNGTLGMTNIGISAPLIKIFGENLKIVGVPNSIGYFEWFGATWKKEDSSINIQKCVDVFKRCFVTGYFNIKNTILIRSKVDIIGNALSIHYASAVDSISDCGFNAIDCTAFKIVENGTLYIKDVSILGNNKTYDTSSPVDTDYYGIYSDIFSEHYTHLPNIKMIDNVRISFFKEGVHVYGFCDQIINSSISNCRWGIHFRSTSDFTITNTDINTNSVALPPPSEYNLLTIKIYQGGGILLESINNSKIINNRIQWNYANIVCVGTSRNLLISNNYFDAGVFAGVHIFTKAGIGSSTTHSIAINNNQFRSSRGFGALAISDDGSTNIIKTFSFNNNFIDDFTDRVNTDYAFADSIITIKNNSSGTFNIIAVGNNTITSKATYIISIIVGTAKEINGYVIADRALQTTFTDFNKVNYMIFDGEVLKHFRADGKIVIKSVIENGITSTRPKVPVIGQLFFDSTLKKCIIFDGNNWINVDGTAL